ncbi:uncharacterized protein YjcR [Paenibacillus cellulosilyticus]|uniref:Uncharacterized protein YjcR n=1 Tax=Paenibacillus cellulosilyticus TaxID=375489 RepID=A0A2V2YX48_9BACL|nr:phage terminase small subunit [Paenibacillus cellulosilyticus]PWW06322.1 uncharacterized protein YjcR [Paenibacillus cellulosilyticus]QKS43458.1 hypothetical protein HUB94_02750 [Paenibacillus cellulosilyticus]QKS46318.1 hypothetical protein HUB94_19110 [Paenibacillus cellulosilyticus]
MARERSTNRTAALKLWLKSGRTMKLGEIADELSVSAALIRKWKFLDKWDEVPENRRRGGQPGNKNSVGNAGGSGAPIGNDYALKHGYYAKYIPEAVMQIVEEIQESDPDPLDMIWNHIIVLEAMLLHGQKITHVSDRDDMTKELKKKRSGKHGTETEYEIQFAHDKFANASKTNVLMMREFRSSMKQFLSMAPENDERRKKLELMDVQIAQAKLKMENAKKDDKKSDAEEWTESLKQVAERRKAMGKET